MCKYQRIEKQGLSTMAICKHKDNEGSICTFSRYCNEQRRIVPHKTENCKLNQED